MHACVIIIISTSSNISCMINIIMIMIMIVIIITMNNIINIIGINHATQTPRQCSVAHFYGAPGIVADGRLLWFHFPLMMIREYNIGFMASM